MEMREQVETTQSTEIAQNTESLKLQGETIG